MSRPIDRKTNNPYASSRLRWGTLAERYLLPEEEAPQPDPQASRRFLPRPAHGLEARLFAAVPIAPLVYFRILFGLVMLWEVTRYLAHGWVGTHFVDPQFFFTFQGLSWIRPWPDDWMYVHFLALGILAVFIVVGLWYRMAAILFFLGFSYVFLLDQTNYLNHFYLIAWVSLLMIFVPAHRAASLDAILRPKVHASIVPTWTLWLLRTQIGIAYFFGGVAKINSDWLQGEPMRMWLAGQTNFPVIGSLFTHAWAPYFFSYTGLLFDLVIVPMLLWRRTREAGVVAAIVFHGINSELFSIGIFPWFMLLATPIFFDPQRMDPVLRFERIFTEPVHTHAVSRTPDHFRPAVMALLAAFACFHLLMPLRHHLYVGNVNWTEEGHQFSWHMKLRDKRGTLKLIATDRDTGAMWEIDQKEYLTPRQRRKMAGRPDMILSFSHYMASRMRDEGRRNVAIRAQAKISLNGRAEQLMIDPSVDLIRVSRSTLAADWVLPLDVPLEARDRNHAQNRTRILR